MTKFKMMPLHVNDCHWAQLIANVLNKSVGIANLMLSYNTDELLEQWKVYMAALAGVVKEDFFWSNTVYEIRQQLICTTVVY